MLPQRGEKPWPRDVLVDPADYDRCCSPGSGTSPECAPASRPSVHATARYDAATPSTLPRSRTTGRARIPGCARHDLDRVYGLRYGENPHQRAAFYRDRTNAGARAPSRIERAHELRSTPGRLRSALDAVREYDQPAAVVVKHTNPCGVAIGDSLASAYRTAREADPLSAFGGIVALNRPVDEATAEVLAETFLECIVAPSYAPGALARLQQKKALRLLATGEWLAADHAALQWKFVGGGLLVQDRDRTAGQEVISAKLVTKRAPSDSERAALDFAWRVCKHVKSKRSCSRRQPHGRRGAGQCRRGQRRDAGKRRGRGEGLRSPRTRSSRPGRVEAADAAA